MKPTMKLTAYAVTVGVVTFLFAEYLVRFIWPILIVPIFAEVILQHKNKMPYRLPKSILIRILGLFAGNLLYFLMYLTSTMLKGNVIYTENLLVAMVFWVVEIPISIIGFVIFRKFLPDTSPSE